MNSIGCGRDERRIRVRDHRFGRTRGRVAIRTTVCSSAGQPSGAYVVGRTGTVTVTFNAPTAGIYYIGIKFRPSSVTGKTAPTPGTTVGYSYDTTGVPGSTSGLNLVKR